MSDEMKEIKEAVVNVRLDIRELHTEMRGFKDLVQLQQPLPTKLCESSMIYDPTIVQNFLLYFHVTAIGILAEQ